MPPTRLRQEEVKFLLAHDPGYRLFRDCLTREQLASEIENGNIQAQGQRFRWLILTTSHMTNSANVYRMLSSDIAPLSASYCAAPQGVTLGDSWLAQKLIIESSEHAWLSVAIGPAVPLLASPRGRLLSLARFRGRL